MLINQKIKGTVISFDRCIEIVPENVPYDGCRHLELCSELDYHLERYEHLYQYNEPLYVYHNMLVEYNMNNEKRTVLFPKAYYLIKIENMQSIVICLNVITKKISIVNGFWE